MRFILVLSLLISINVSAQWKSYIIGVRGDTLNRVDFKGKKQGPWVIHVDELRGEDGYDEQGYYKDDRKEGTWKKFALAGDKIAEENYRFGSLDGKSRYFNNTGGLIREESWRVVDPTKAYDTIDVYDINDPSRIVDHVIVKTEGQTYKHGEWTYYDGEWGTIQKTERYFLNKLLTGNENGSSGDADIKPLDVSAGRNKSDTTGKAAMKKPQVILDYEKKNAGKKKVKTRDGNTGL